MQFAASTPFDLPTLEQAVDAAIASCRDRVIDYIAQRAVIAMVDGSPVVSRLKEEQRYPDPPGIPRPLPSPRTTWAAIASDADPGQDLWRRSPFIAQWSDRTEETMQFINERINSAMIRRRFPAMRRDPDPIEIEAPNPVSFEIHVTSDRPTDGTYSAAVDRISDAMKKFAPCQGCRFFHGGVYGAELLVCAVHPYGVDGSECPDYESDQLLSTEGNLEAPASEISPGQSL